MKMNKIHSPHLSREETPSSGGWQTKRQA